MAAQYTTTYATLIALIEDYVEDGSTEFDGAVQGFVNRAEERILRDLDLEIFNSSTSISTTNGQAYTTKSVAEPILSVYFTASGQYAERRSRDYIQAYGGSGRPLYFYETSDRIYWAPTPDAVYAGLMTQVVRPTKLSGSNSTNWLAENAADALLWASLVECEKFLIAPERIPEFEQSYAQTIGPLRAFWRNEAQTDHEPLVPTPAPVQTR